MVPKTAVRVMAKVAQEWRVATFNRRAYQPVMDFSFVGSPSSSCLSVSTAAASREPIRPNSEPSTGPNTKA